MYPSLFYRPGALLSPSELSAARLDGLLFEVGDGYIHADLPEDAAARVASLASVLAPGYAASGATAAWVHGFGDAAPLCHHIQRATPRRQRVTPQRNVVVHEIQLAPTDVVTIAGAQVTTLPRTLTDLALRADRDAEGERWLRALGAARPDLLLPVRQQIASRKRMPGKRAAVTALNLLREAYCQDVVTR
ncbi:hypothetical protein [Microbacterium sp. A93]|uniref:hypothetical protein n=1 Tax=Microbacterium sp. A93 TaxID=3450716 RepID=UPI003F43DF22